MKFKIENKTKRYIFYLIILLILYYFVETLPLRQRQSRNDMVSENIKSLEDTTKELSDIIAQDKEAINNFFYNQKTSEKILGLIKTYPADRELKISDNVKIFLQQEGNPVKISYKDNEFEIVNTKVRDSEDSKNNVAITYDVLVTKNPNAANNYELIHDLKTYMVDSYGQDAFDNFLDRIIEQTIKENEELINKLNTGKKEK
ncbi:hypothetical protein [Anaerococcus sp. Marseille-Q5996]|uniref:hypothetical protein n=1 Tax=Anaerococcus sp. Marseille-Q5996 TaxID=2972769 RepID=UPI0021C9892D|nr:hypothetical protein [Anaerococcus sp. Marseille-Q5996]